MKIALTSDTHWAAYGQTTVKRTRKMWQRLAEEDFDILIHAGDWCTKDARKQMRRAVIQCRRYIDKPILTILGNHDFWDNPRIDPRQMLLKHSATFEKHNVHYLLDNPFYYKDFVFVGFDGWYNNINPPTNDSYWMPMYVEGVPIHKWMNKKIDDDFGRVISYMESNKRVVCVTHFSPFVRPDDYKGKDFSANENYLPFITDKSEYLLLGHSHAALRVIKEGCIIIECGSDYNEPTYLIEEIKEKK